jgi:hypothetical protein
MISLDNGKSKQNQKFIFGINFTFWEGKIFEF